MTRNNYNEKTRSFPGGENLKQSSVNRQIADEKQKNAQREMERQEKFRQVREELVLRMKESKLHI